MQLKTFIPLGARIEFIPVIKANNKAGNPKAYNGTVARINHLLNGSTEYTIQSKGKANGISVFIERVVNDMDGEVRLLTY